MKKTENQKQRIHILCICVRSWHRSTTSKAYTCPFCGLQINCCAKETTLPLQSCSNFT